MIRGLALLLTASAVAAAGFRAANWSRPDADLAYKSEPFFDFNHGVYYPAVALRDGVSPYGMAFTREYPFQTPIPLYTPSALVLHLPLTLLPLPVAQWTYFAINVGLLLGVAAVAGRAVGSANAGLSVALLAAASRGGHGTLISGYFTLELVLGTVLALEYGKRRPWVAAAGIVLAGSKANFLFPLLLAMAARGNLAAVARGAALVAVLSLAAVGWLLTTQDVGALVQDYREWVAAEPQIVGGPQAWAAHSWISIDLQSLAAKWGGYALGLAPQLAVMTLLMAPVCWTLWRLRRSGDAGGALTPSGVIASLAVVASIYHLFYDALVLAPAAVALAARRPTSAWRAFPPSACVAVALCSLTPLFNVLSVQSVLDVLAPESASTLHKTLTSINGAALLVGLVLLGLVAVRTTQRPAAASRQSEAP